MRNRLLAALPADVIAALLPKLSPVILSLKQVIYAPDTPIEAVYFLETGMISLVDNLEDGMRAEVGVIGREGMLGMPLLAGVNTSFIEAQVQLPGTALRMTAQDFTSEIDTNTALRKLLLRYSEALQAQVMQTAACNVNHGLEQRLARWLLIAHDRSTSDELSLTQEFMATSPCSIAPASKPPPASVTGRFKDALRPCWDKTRPCQEPDRQQAAQPLFLRA